MEFLFSNIVGLTVLFAISLFVLVKSADWFLNSAEKIGLSMGLSPFIVGVTIVGVGTSLPELTSSFAAVMNQVPEIVVANAVGSNIANILLVIGISTVIGKRLKADKSLIDLDLPLLAAGTGLFFLVAYDGFVTLIESIILIVAYAIYLLYTLSQRDNDHSVKAKDIVAQPKIMPVDHILLLAGFVGLILGSRFLIDSVIGISELMNVLPGVIAISAVALGTSLPELLVSGKAALRGKSSIVLGNILGSNIFNILMVVGVPGLFVTLPVDERTLGVGMVTMLLATVLFVFSGISEKIHRWEGMFFLLLYVVFIGKLFALF